MNYQKLHHNTKAIKRAYDNYNRLDRKKIYSERRYKKKLIWHKLACYTFDTKSLIKLLYPHSNIKKAKRRVLDIMFPIQFNQSTETYENKTDSIGSKKQNNKRSARALLNVNN